MKKLFTLLTMILIVSTAQAQMDNAMNFGGPSKFGVADMNAWQENERDVIIFKMNSTSDADITLPALTYNAMHMTIPSFTIHGAKFTFDYATRNAEFEEQTYSETVEVDGAEKIITGYSLVASYEASTQTFKLITKFSYGSMPLQVTYEINATYEKADAINHITNEPGRIYWDLTGRKVNQPKHGSIYIVNGKKVRYE